MNTTPPALRGRIFIGTCAGLIILVSFIVNRYYPARALSGENSIGTWLSVFLLAGCSTAALVAAMRRNESAWWFFPVFFIVLALDERFMFHERIKQRIVFSFIDPAGVSPFIAELPVMGGVLIGVFVAYLMWKCISPQGRWFLGAGVLCGSISAVLDIISRYMLIEDLCKVTGELMVLMCLLGEAVVTPERERSIKHGG